MRAIRFFFINLVWFSLWFWAWYTLDKAERGGAFIWRSWHLFLALGGVSVCAFFVARVHDQMKPARSDVSLSSVGATLVLVFNAMVAVVVYAVAILFIYGE